METYLDKNGKLLPKFYQDPKWKVMGSILVTVADCMCCIATWGFAIYLVLLKSLFIIAYSMLCPCSSSDVSSKKNAEEAKVAVAVDSKACQTSRKSNVRLPSSDTQRSQPSTPDFQASAVASTSEKSIRAVTPEIEISHEGEMVARKIYGTKVEAFQHALNEFKDPEESA
ncbi:uncharacterized protein LOC129969302 [Argiope bruennichi]|uniref:uncharacterized protein LOC129969302 n=1 Tax=Argiope bruennichi TaxID=94029 RepID=UPI0024957935|nr:uncharacterized protein LOC129969302 [Argiope bruennichi]